MMNRYLLIALAALALCLPAGRKTAYAQTSETLSARLLKATPSTLVEQALSNGDPRRGAILFHQAQLQCSKCHSVTGPDTASTALGRDSLGPNLTQWKSSRFQGPPDREYLVESILRPSAKLREGYLTAIVLTEDDEVVTGILLDTEGDSITLAEATGDGQPRTFAKEGLEVRLSTKSIMPEGLVDQLASVEQFYDLISYVIEISEQGADRAAELQPSPDMLTAPTLPDYESNIAHAEMIRNWNEESLQRGSKIYGRVCANCHGTHDREGSLPTSPRFATSKLKHGSDPYTMYRTLTHGFGLMVSQRWMVPQQKYDVIHFIREAYFKEHNPQLYTPVDADYLAGLPPGDTFGPEPSRFEPYVAMNYGPSLINTYEIELNNDGNHIGRDLGRSPKSNDPWANPDRYFEHGEAPNYAYKGIAIRLDAGPGGISRGRQWAVYDHDTMSLNGFWSGESFVDYCGIQFDGQHAVHNRLKGELHLENPVGPGWAQPLTGVFQDPRPVGRDGRAYGPLPSAWYQYLGLYHHGLKTILSYRVGQARILEHASTVTDEASILVRHLTMDPAEHPLKLRLGPPNLHIRISKGEQEETLRGIAIHETDNSELGGFKYLEIPAHDRVVHLSVYISPKAFPGDFVTSPPLDLTRWTQGGPPRWPERVTTPIRTTFEEEFAVDELNLPTQNPWSAQVRATGLDFYSDNRRMALCTWDGDVWLITGADQDQGELTWQRIATGLFQPLGLKIVDDQVYVTCRDQLVILRDLNGDHETDFYECFNSDHQVTEHFHEFAMGLQRDEAGNFYYAKSARHAKRAVVPHHGTLLQVSPDGKSTKIIANGFRAANGVCLNDDGSFFVTDQEGHWNPKNRINWVTEGGFYGNMYTFTDHIDSSDSAMTQPLCWITNSFDRSPAELLWVPKDAWGPLGGSLLNLSYGYGRIFVVPHESRKGILQGGMCQLPIPDFKSGSIRGRFHPMRKDLYVCGMFSWAGSRQEPGCFYRIRYTGKPVHLPLRLQAAERKMKIEFSHPIDAQIAADVSRYEVTAWDLDRTPNYGSQHINERDWNVDNATLSNDGKTLFLEIPDLEPTWGMSIEYKLRGADGRTFDGAIHNSVFSLGEVTGDLEIEGTTISSSEVPD